MSLAADVYRLYGFISAAIVIVWLLFSSLLSAPTGCNADSGTEPSCYFIRCEDVLGLPSDSHSGLLVASRMKVYSYCIGKRILLTSKARCGDKLRVPSLILTQTKELNKICIISFFVSAQILISFMYKPFLYFISIDNFVSN